MNRCTKHRAGVRELLDELERIEAEHLARCLARGAQHDRGQEGGVMVPYYERDGIRLHVGDCREVVPTLPEPASAVCTDPPYGLGFMGKDWDHEVPGEAFWRVFSDAMLPGAHLLSFGGTRTYHRIAVNIEDAGFEIRDTLQWLYGSGFPKSLDVSKAIDKSRRRDYVQAAADLGLEIPGNNLHDWTKAEHSPGDVWWEKFKAHLSEDDWQRIERRVIGHGHRKNDRDAVSIKLGRVSDDYDITVPATPEAEQWAGWGTALKPAYEPIILARKPLAGTVAANVLAHGTGAINIDASRVGTEVVKARKGGFNDSPIYGTSEGGVFGGREGRWPANVILDEHAAALLDEQAGERKSGAIRAGQPAGRNIGKPGVDREVAYQRPPHQHDIPASAGGASRFFYVAKASRAERNAGLDGMPAKMLRWSAGEQNPGSFQSDGTNKYSQNHHPTVKPLALMRWLLTLVTPPGGIVLDPFVGSGSTLVACAQLGIPAYGIDMNEEYIEIAARRIDHALNERAREEAKPRQLMIAD